MNDKILEEQKRLNEKLANFLSKKGIKNLRLISLGNSIASGFSAVRTTKPLLLRNESISSILKEENIDVDIHHFARAQNNNDEHVFEWINSNISESEIHKLNRADYSGGKAALPMNELSNEKLDEYYPLNMENDIKLKDAIVENNKDLANIVIYNGATGSFLDGVTRQGTFAQKLMKSVKRDVTSIEATLKLIQSNNRENNGNTQVYICGAPNFLGLRVSELINRKLKKVVKEYANVTYVEPIKSKFIYEKLDVVDTDLSSLQETYKKHSKAVDIHYDEEEYLKFNNNILNSINDNYQMNESLIEIDRYLFNLSKEIEIEHNELIDDKNKRRELIDEKIKEELSKNENKKEFLKRVKKYLTNRSPFDFYYVGKKEIKDVVTDVKRNL